MELRLSMPAGQDEQVRPACGTCEKEKTTRPGDLEAYVRTDDYGQVFLWAEGQTLLWKFLEHESSLHVPECLLRTQRVKEEVGHLLQEAEQKWRNPPIKICETDCDRQAHFYVQFAADRVLGGQLEALSFFPTTRRGETLFLYPYLWRNPGAHEYIVNTIAHELGHIYGLLHSFSVASIHGAIVRYKTRPAEQSIMAYTTNRVWALTDVQELQDLYEAAWKNKDQLAYELEHIPRPANAPAEPKVHLLRLI